MRQLDREQERLIINTIIGDHKELWLTSMQFRIEIHTIVRLLPHLVDGIAEQAQAAENEIKDNQALLEREYTSVSLDFPSEWKSQALRLEESD